MRETTTVRVSRETRDDLRALADDDGVALDVEIRRLVRAERQRRIGQALAAISLDDDDRSWLEAGAQTLHDDAGR